MYKTVNAYLSFLRGLFLNFKLSINQSLNHYFIVRPKIDQRAGQVSLPHEWITKKERNRTKKKIKTGEQINPPPNGLEPRDQSDRRSNCTGTRMNSAVCCKTELQFRISNNVFKNVGVYQPRLLTCIIICWRLTRLCFIPDKTTTLGHSADNGPYGAHDTASDDRCCI